MNLFIAEEERNGSKHGSRKSGLVNDVLSVQHKVYILFKSCSLGFFQSSGGFHSLIRGLFELINRESSLDQRRTEEQRWRAEASECSATKCEAL